MRLGHFAAWAPRCPVCARAGRAAPLGVADGAREHDGDVVAGRLLCADPACRREYPIVDGIPVISADLPHLLRERGVELLLREDLSDDVLGLLGDALGADSWLEAIRSPASTYGWDAYADLDPSEPAGDPAPGAARRCLAHLLALCPQPARPILRVLDVGCGGGRTAFDAAASAPEGLVLGIDTNLALLRLARRVATAGVAVYARRRIGLVYDTRRFAAELPGRERVDFWACDADALPFAPGSADLVLALNLLDCVPDPVALLHALAGLLTPGARLLLATPFDWAARATPMEHWIGGHSARGSTGGAAEPLLDDLLRPGGHERAVHGLARLGTGDHEWTTRLHDRAAVRYRTHLVALERT